MDEILDKVMQAWAGQVWSGLLDGSGAHPTGASLLDVDSSWILDEWEREFFERLLTQARGGSVRFVESSVGGGRSHFLHLLAARARRSGMATVFLAPESQAECWQDSLQLYRQIAGAVLSGRSPGQPGLPALAASGPADLARAELFPDFPIWGLALQAWAEKSEPAARDFLLGEPVGPAGEAIGLHAGLTSRQGTHALGCLLRYLDFRQEKGLVALSDGDGYIEDSQERITLESLRNLIDSCAGGELPSLLLVFAVLPRFRQQVLPEYEALQQRLHNGFSIGPAGCLRPILILEEQRRWRATQGIDFRASLVHTIQRLAVRIHPELDRAPALLRRNIEAMLDELPWDETTPGAARGLTRTIARWFADPGLALDSSEPDHHAALLERFLNEEAV